MVCGHTTEEPMVSKVPLSCVPPCTSFGLAGFTDKLWNCKVFRPLLRLVHRDGTADSSHLHCCRSDPLRPRLSQRAEVSLNVPSDRMTPPSEPSQTCSGLFGLATRVCWSGCRPLGAVGLVASSVRSDHVAPASRDST